MKRHFAVISILALLITVCSAGCSEGTLPTGESGDEVTTEATTELSVADTEESAEATTKATTESTSSVTVISKAQTERTGESSTTKVVDINEFDFFSKPAGIFNSMNWAFDGVNLYQASDSLVKHDIFTGEITVIYSHHTTEFKLLDNCLVSLGIGGCSIPFSYHSHHVTVKYPNGKSAAVEGNYANDFFLYKNYLYLYEKYGNKDRSSSSTMGKITRYEIIVPDDISSAYCDHFDSTKKHITEGFEVSSPVVMSGKYLYMNDANTDSAIRLDMSNEKIERLASSVKIVKQNTYVQNDHWVLAENNGKLCAISTDTNKVIDFGNDMPERVIGIMGDVLVAISGYRLEIDESKDHSVTLKNLKSGNIYTIKNEHIRENSPVYGYDGYYPISLTYGGIATSGSVYYDAKFYYFYKDNGSIKIKPLIIEPAVSGLTVTGARNNVLFCSKDLVYYTKSWDKLHKKSVF